MRKWTGLCVLLICLMALQTACAEGGTTAQMLQDYAGQQAAHLEGIKNDTEFVQWYANAAYGITDQFDPNQESCLQAYRTLLATDFTKPVCVTVFLPKGDLDLMHYFHKDPPVIETQDDLKDAACSILYRLPLTMSSRNGTDMAWDYLSQILTIDDACNMEGVDSAAYVIQYFGKDTPMIVTSVVSVDAPTVLTHTQFLYGSSMKNTEALLFSNMAQFFGDDLEVTRTIIDAAP